MMHAKFEPVFMILREMWDRRLIGVGIACLVAVLAATLVVNIPERYEAASRVYVDTQTMLKPLMQGLAVEPDIDQMVAMLARNLITRPRLETLIDKVHFTDGDPDPPGREAVIQKLTRDIKFTSTGGKNLFDVVYRDTDPQRALRITQELVALFVTSGKGDRLRDTEETRQFIDEQIALYDSKLKVAENALKNFKLKNVDVLGASNQDYFSRMASTQQDLSQARVELRSAEESRDSLQRELKGLSEKLAPATGGSATPELDARIDAQSKQLDELRRRFTENHPDVIAARRMIALLMEERQRKVNDLAKNSAPGLAQQANPVYQQIKIKFAEADANVASLRGRTEELSNRLDILRSSAARVPQVEAEMAQLNRDYDVVKRNYEQLVQRREAASISGDADASARLAEFRVIEPPRVGAKPVFPSRLAMVGIALLVSIASGIGACYGMSQMRSTIHTLRSLRLATDRPSLGSVSLVASVRVQLQQRQHNIIFAGTLAILIAIYGVWAIKLFSASVLS